jgi:glycosyltransferase involved in cell wall biosynthesis
MSGPPRLSVIVPAYQAAGLLPDTLGALRAAREPSGGWELIVVDDASRDGTAEVAGRFANRVIRLEGNPGGPARARNAGAAAARGEWLLFVDADVRVHPDTLSRVIGSLEAHPTATAIFGAYDASPSEPGLVSRYRNLLHRYVHLMGTGPAATFWAGLGCVRADAFRAVGGFDAARYPRPQIEDIELGYRLRERGAMLILDPVIQGTHLKRWTLRRMLLTDFRDRAIPWMRLLLERRDRDPAALSVRPRERIRVAVAGAALAMLAAGILLDARLLAGAMAALIGLAASNLAVYRWFASHEGPAFALAVVPLHLGYYVANAVAVVAAVGAHAWQGAGAAPPPQRPREVP